MSRLREVASRARVSVSTASAVLNGRADCYASEETRSRVRRAASELGYLPNRVARSLVRGKTDTLGLVVFEVNNPFFANVVDQVELAVREAGYDLILCNSRSGGRASNRDNVELLAQHRVDGILLWASSYPPAGYLIPRPAAAAPALVLLGHRSADGTDYVAVDRAAGAYQAARHLIDLGHTRLGYLAPAGVLAGEDPKLDGLRRATAEAGLPAPALLPAGDSTRAGGREAARGVAGWSPRPTALVCYNDLIAVGAYLGLRDAGVSVPGEMALVGYDGIEEGEYLASPLTTVAQPVREMCRLGTQYLLARIDGRAEEPQHRTLVPRLVVRESCGVRTPGGRIASLQAEEADHLSGFRCKEQP